MERNIGYGSAICGAVVGLGALGALAAGNGGLAILAALFAAGFLKAGWHRL
jgi:hypothetical protein